ncbi:AAA family ATPase [Solwaraspora sp. WMMA2056]|uniref:helix-turn-helix transcriptional regulator n=1 Tax=Solwaraspora sp. WMMA2056 TaxID=3015161 RepID=UPI00259B8259|nr:LuxR family transcriptional regulator [Solwaraspora sp. WMMA2056]WJK41292.1 AAA family ATPase [Solwaraspora sp. WMMA2056]
MIGLTQSREASSLAWGADDVPFVGRRDQLRVLHESLRRVERGDTAAVFVMGESGIGKTRLLSAASDRLRTAGALVLTGACLDIGDSSPLHPLRQALRRYRPEPGHSGAVASAAARDLLAVLDGDARDPDGAGAVLERVSRGLGGVAAGRTLVLAVDDLQWADLTTRHLLLYLIAGLSDVRLLLLAAARSETLQADDPIRRMVLELRRSRARSGAVHVLELTPLDRAETAELVAEVVGGPPDPELAESVWRRSGGVPFVAEELARDARDGRVGLSETLREITLAHVDALPADAQLVSHAVAAGVEPVAHDLLAGVVQLAEDRLLQAVRDAVGQRVLLSEPDGYRFRYPLIREVLQPRLLPGERTRWHRRYAETLAAVPSGDLQHARLAYHWREAGETTRALPAVVAAAEEAERLYGFAEAFEHWASAVDLANQVPPAWLMEFDVTTLGRRAAEAAHRSGEHERALALLEQLATNLFGPPPSWLYTLRARYLTAVGQLAAAEREYDRTLAAADVAPSERVAAAAHSADLLLQLCRYADAGRRAREALDLAAGVPDAASAMVLAGVTLGYSQAYLNDPAAGKEAVREARRTAESFGGPEDVAVADLQLAELLSGPLNELEDGVAVARQGAERAERVGLARTYGTRLLSVAANGLFRLGRWAEAEELIAAALRHRPSGADAVELLLARCRIHVGFGRLDGAEADLEAIETLLAAGGGVRYMLPLLTLRAGLAMWRGRHREARDAVGQGIDLAESRSDDVWLQAPLVWHGLRAEAEARSAGAPPCPKVVQRLVGVVERMERSSTTDTAAPVRDAVIGYRELCAAEISRIDGRSDPALWDRAAQVWERRSHPYPAAYARLRQAEALYAIRTRNAEATRALQSAYRTARRLGARPFTEEIQALAKRARIALHPGESEPMPEVDSQEPVTLRAGLTSPPSVGDRVARALGNERSGRSSVTERTSRTLSPRTADELAVLTDRERQVLELVAEGRTNRATAEALFISERTVGVHVSNILNKLQVKTRVEATRVFMRNQPRA